MEKFQARGGSRDKLAWLVMSALAVGCSDEPQFDCADMEDAAALMFCDDFNEGDASAWEAEGGRFAVEGGRYIGEGPDEVGGACGASLMTASLREGSTARDLTMHAELRSLERLDKVMVLRASDPSNRIELNFRADPLNDLIVQELVDCELVYRTTEGEVPIPHTMSDDLLIDVTLQGDQLIVLRDGEPVLDREFDFANTEEGAVGVAVIEDAVTSFDSVWVEAL